LAGLIGACRGIAFFQSRWFKTVAAERLFPQEKDA
jgi:hypothetical protein